MPRFGFVRRRGRASSSPAEPRAVCMVVHAYYDEDPRVRREAEALVAAGRPVEVYALRRPGDAPTAVVEGVTVHRLPVQRHQGADLATYLREYLAFFLRAAAAATLGHMRRRFVLAQVHSLPDFLVFAAFPMRLAGVPLVLDLHEATPELFRSRFPHVRGRLLVGLVEFQERVSTRAADVVLTVNEAMAERLRTLGVPDETVHVVLNAPPLEHFDPAAHPVRAFMSDGVLRLIYAGALTPIYELEIVLDAVAQIATTRPELDVRLDLYGRGDTRPRLEARSARLGIAHRVQFHGRIPLEAVPAAIAASDIGIAPTRRDHFTELTMSTKIFEYSIMGKPVVASRLRTVERYFPPASLTLYESGSRDELASAILSLVDQPSVREERTERTRARVLELGWDREGARYVALVERLVSEAVSSTVATHATQEQSGGARGSHLEEA